jgi:YidC/Oxa1 family membrane protein insertase
VSLLKIPSVRAYFRIPKVHHIDPDTLPMKKKPFMESAKESWSNMKVARELSERQRIDEMKFRDAGTGPLVKTYKYDPTKQKQGGAPAAVAMKSRQS